MALAHSREDDKKKPQGRVSISRALISVFGTTLQCSFTEKKTQRMQHGIGVPQGEHSPHNTHSHAITVATSHIP